MVKVKSLFAGLCALALVAGAALAEPQPILLWPDGAPGSEGKTAPETMRINPPDEQVVSNVNFPSITPYLPDPGKATGAALTQPEFDVVQPAAFTIGPNILARFRQHFRRQIQRPGR